MHRVMEGAVAQTMRVPAKVEGDLSGPRWREAKRTAKRNT